VGVPIAGGTLIVIGSSASTAGVVAGKAGCRTIQLALIVAFWRASLDTPTRKEEKRRVARVAPVLSTNLCTVR
jgi:hypothetical protein